MLVGGWGAVALGGHIAGYEPFSPEANQVDHWCSGPEWAEGEKLEREVSGADVWIADDAAPGGSAGARVVVKAGSGEFANTIWDGVYDGDAVWADSNGNGVYDVGGQDGDKTISHIIVCKPPEEVVVPTATATAAPPVVETSPSPSPSPSEPAGGGPAAGAGTGGGGREELPGTGAVTGSGGDIAVWWLGAGSVMAGAVLGSGVVWGVRRAPRRATRSG